MLLHEYQRLIHVPLFEAEHMLIGWHMHNYTKGISQVEYEYIIIPTLYLHCIYHNSHLHVFRCPLASSKA